MRNNSQLESITTIEDSKIVYKIMNQNNIFPIIKQYTSVTNSQITKNTNSKNSNCNSSNSSRIIYRNNINKSSNDILNTRYHNSELFPFPQKKKFEEKKNMSFKLLKGKVYITESSLNQISNNNSEINEETDRKNKKSLLEKLKNVKFTLLKDKNTKIKIGNKMSVKDYISKTKELNLMKYNLKRKKERAKRIIEDKKSQSLSIDHTINSINKYKQQFIKGIYVKYNDYLKMIERQYKKEVFENNNLLRQIEIIKNDLLLIQVKIKKALIKKEKIGRWLFLQIQVKEKLSSIPGYYYSILENNNINLKNIEEKEIERVKKYKGTIIYDNLNDFINEFHKIQDNTLQSLKENQIIREQIIQLKIEKKNLEKALNKIDKNEINLINEKEITLNNLKQTYMKIIYKGLELENLNNNIPNNRLKKEKSFKDLNDNFYIHHKTINIIPKGYLFHSLSQDCLTGKNIKKGKYSKIYIKIYEIFKNSLEYRNIKELKFINHLNDFSKVSNTNESKMLNMLEFIEEVINDLFHKNQIYKSNPLLFIQFKKAYNVVDHINKERKYIKQMEIMREKRRNVIQKIEERINKKYFLPHRKVAVNFSNKIKKSQVNSLKKENSSSIELKDFLYDT